MLPFYRVPSLLISRKRRITLEQLCTLWLEAKKSGLKLSTYVKYSNTIRLHILPHLGKKQAKDLTQAELEQYAGRLLSSGRTDGTGGLSGKTVRDILSLLHSILEFAQEKDLIDEIPQMNMGIQVPRGQLKVMDQEECRCLEAFLKTRGDVISCGILLALYTGMRLGEICALRWEHIDLDHGTLQVQGTIQRLQNVEAISGEKTSLYCLPPKSASGFRQIPLTDTMTAMLRPLLTEQRKAFFLTGSEHRCMEPRLLEYHFQQILRQCGMERIHFHVLRHTFATRCMELGFDTKSLSEILGHANVQTTLALYVHPTLEFKRKNMHKVYF